MGSFILITTISTGCSLGTTDVPSPSTIIDPSIVTTPEGALGLYRGSVSTFALVFGGTVPTTRPEIVTIGSSYILTSGYASDEFISNYGNLDPFVQRLVDPAFGTKNNSKEPYQGLHKTRVQIDQTIGALRKYGSELPSSFVGEMFALKGYIYIMFGELYCSGIPFSRAIYGGDIVLGHPESTQEMFEHAVAQFDTAIALSSDSTRILRLARVGKARALLNLAKYDSAEVQVTDANIPTNFAYRFSYSVQNLPNFQYPSLVTDAYLSSAGILFLGNQQGGNGIAYVTIGDSLNPQQDSRVAWTPVREYGFGTAYPIIKKYSTGGDPIVLADGIEARLIQAEVALRKQDVGRWAGILNTLRQSAGALPLPAISGDSTTDLTVPDTLRQNVMFYERALWLFGTGHRFGDLRRLIRQYGRSPGKVFPVGPVVAGTRQRPITYSNSVNFVPPREEQDNNPNYRGCLNRDA